ncbi:poly-beta-1,6-N-acetyl-D-glucosamine synthase [Paenalcaligenes niemegkensis]|uniref:poly-beta-1,6-N-acetyl-D-glucosamine synthase n=1 Tax=Paenalcaligenes niemegkensis TaxID=2895469 RepID=UPI001EE96CB2|nr:poly-beta-1,6-N-acetyl-D-glucosamine synthase [Paenalcaligenes niemegkensis]MCQ9616446.1 poly-beta-1,6-N-acetyl-D-glucosamine synthase [Paenalcaligenes niemegkensis]
MTERIVGLLALISVIALPLYLYTSGHQFVLMLFIFFYPLFMGCIWISGGLYFWFQWERQWSWRPAKPPALPGNPLVSILIPCYNEAAHCTETIAAALGQIHSNIEVIAINDGSSDLTRLILDDLSQADPRLRIVHLAANQGKAMALTMGAMAARSPYLVCIDGDALLDPDAVNYLVAPMIHHPQVGAITGNPRIRTRSTLIGRIQVGEFSSIIGLIKRTQRVFGRLFTVSGVICAFRREALEECGYWSLNMATEDIDITWKLQLRGWNIFYEPRALCWVLMPETLNGLWKQRQRWAQGGAETFLKYLPKVGALKHHKLWGLLTDYYLSVLWSFSLAITSLFWLLESSSRLSFSETTASLPPAFTGLLLGCVCLFQFLTSLLIDRRYEPSISRALYWIIWYPFVFWLINCLTCLRSFPIAMLRSRGRARWVSPDRGIEEKS